jgi:hypothetical protein
LLNRIDRLYVPDVTIEDFFLIIVPRLDDLIPDLKFPFVLFHGRISSGKGARECRPLSELDTFVQIFGSIKAAPLARQLG